MSTVFALPRGATKSAGDRLVLLALADAANDEDGIAWPSMERIAEKVGMTRRGAQLAVHRVRDAGLIEEVDDLPQSALDRMAGLRADRRPIPYRLVFLRGEQSPPREDDHGANSATPTGRTPRHHGANSATPRGEPQFTRTVIEPKGNQLPEPLLPTSVGETKPTDRQRDPVFDAIAVATGVDLEELSRDDGKRIGMVAADLRGRWNGNPDNLPDEIANRVRRLRAKWGDKTVTPTALAKHWSSLGKPKRTPTDEDRFAGSEAERILSL